MCGSFSDTWQNGLFYRQLAYTIYYNCSAKGCAGDQIQAGVKRPCREVDPSDFLQITLRRSVFVLKVGVMLH